MDVIVHPYVVFGPGVTVAGNVEIRSFSHIEGAKIGKSAIIGPFARIRPGSGHRRRSACRQFRRD